MLEKCIIYIRKELLKTLATYLQIDGYYPLQSLPLDYNASY